MIGWIKPALGIVLRILDIFKGWKAEKAEAEAREDGKREVAAEQLEAIERSRQEREAREREAVNLSDPELDARLEQWMRRPK